MTSPGTRYWQASDGNWYPQQYEYTWLTTGLKFQLKQVVEEVAEKSNILGQRGWELVNYTVDIVNDMAQGTAIWKRPQKH